MQMYFLRKDDINMSNWYNESLSYVYTEVYLVQKGMRISYKLVMRYLYMLRCFILKEVLVCNVHSVCLASESLPWQYGITSIRNQKLPGRRKLNN